ncbi:response regulator [Lacibacterium aquatile]|uniref:histidine kinase n=1 Tax=Lacibacterium aquatile TaxID=1168082 RepID=A0ABW5DSQ8_9PROT
MTAAIAPLIPRAARILVVEDSETQALQIRSQLEAQGFNVTTVPSAEGALARLNDRLPDLLIVDLHLPGMNGDEFVRQLRLNGGTRALPVLMLTGANEREQERLGLESGADAYVAKSADWDLIVLRMRALLRRRPDDDPDAHLLREPSPSLATFRRARVMIQHHSATFRLYLEGLAAQEGYEIQVATDERALLDIASSSATAPDAILLDTSTGNPGGVELCRRLNVLRNITGAPGLEPPSFHIICIGSDGEAAKQVLEDAFAAGADDFIPSSIDAESLRVRVRTLVRRKLLQDEDRRIESELRARELAIARAQTAAAAAAARASMADELAQANAELAAANQTLKDTQAKLVQAAKMASLGELVAGIAHEINNPLAFIVAHQGTVERLLRDVASKVPTDGPVASVEKARTRLDSMRLGLKRIQDLVLNLRKFSRLDEAGAQTIDVREAIDIVLALLAHKLSSRIIVTRDHEGAANLYCSPAIFNQVMMNIVGNAADAIEGDGSIAIRTHSDGQNYIIEISDSGPGIPEEMRERIFEPFFTTKPVGTGTGLGLAIAYSVVQAHDGTISVGTGPKGGACFTISIPLKGTN